MTTALISGMAGFVGSHLAEYLLANTDWDIVGFVRWQDPLDNLENVAPWINRGERVWLAYGDLCDALSVPWIDLSGPLRSAGPEAAQLYWRRDQHFNGRGHEAAAAAIARWLSAASRVPDRQDHGESAVDADPGRGVR